MNMKMMMMMMMIVITRKLAVHAAGDCFPLERSAKGRHLWTCLSTEFAGGEDHEEDDDNDNDDDEEGDDDNNEMNQNIEFSLNDHGKQ